MAKWKHYQNGNYTVSIDLETGTKIRENDLDNLMPAFSESCDCLISTVCDGGCEFCYEGCTPNGKHADILNLPFLDTLHPYTEMAIGGNDLSHPDLIPFLRKMKKKHIIVNMTVSQTHFERHFSLVKKMINEHLIYGLGVSLKKPTKTFIAVVKKYPNIVIHTINGITTMDDYKKLADNNLKILILGYKELCRGHEYYDNNRLQIAQNQAELFYSLSDMIDNKWFNVISFDNLAINQLDVKRCVTDKQWDEFYMGDDSEYTFYLDLVEKKFAKNSIAPESERYDLLDSIDDMFNVIRKQGMSNE